MLDGRHENLWQPAFDTNIYILGQIERHNVVILSLHTGSNTQAATAITQMKSAFPSIQYALLVGIGGGVPTAGGHHIKLGHVVVSTPSDTYPGIIQYDHGKAQGGKLIRTGALDKPPVIFLNASNHVETFRFRQGSDTIADNLKRIDTTKGYLARFKQPEDKYDCFEESKGVDDDSQPSSCYTPNSSRILIHRGTIAAGELVVKDGDLRDGLAKQYRVLCFETEAVGALNSLPTIVIRGISDYADSRKNDLWHGFAAAAAAGYARELISHLPMTQAPGEKMMIDEEERKAIIQWLKTKVSPSNYGSRQADQLRRRHENTGQWALDSPEYQHWLKQPREILFCSGKPGAGKSVLTSIVINHLEQKFGKDSTTVGIAYIYCDFKLHLEQRPAHLVANLVKQLVHADKTPPESLKDLYTDYEEKGTTPSLDSWSEVFCDLITTYHRTFIIVDALDECSASYTELDAYPGSDLADGYPLFIKETLKAQANILHHKSLTVYAQNVDVEKYIEETLSEATKRFILKDAMLRQRIKAQIMEVADGMFLLVVLYLHRVVNASTAAITIGLLNELPKGDTGYGLAYTKALEAIRSMDTRREMQHALAMATCGTEISEYDIPDDTEIISACSALVTIDAERKDIRLVHQTAQEYLVRTWHDWFDVPKHALAQLCISYLSLDHFMTGRCETHRDLHGRLAAYSLYEYASCNWGHHARGTAAENDKIILDFLMNNTDAVPAAYQVLLVRTGYAFDQTLRAEELSLGPHMAAFFGLASVLKYLRDRGYFLGLPDGLSRMPLSWAARNGYESVVKLLLAEDEELVPADWPDANGKTPLCLAAEHGHHSVVMFLLARPGISVNAKDKAHEQTPVALAAENGHDEVVKLLCGTPKVDLNTKDQDYGQTPLMWALENGHISVVRTLLQARRTEPNMEDDSGRRPLWMALESGDRELVELLLKRDDIDPNVLNENGKSPLRWALENKNETVLRLLLSVWGTDPNFSKDQDGQTPLWWALYHKYQQGVEFLLRDKRTDVSTQNSASQTPFWWALENKNRDWLKVLLRTDGVNPNLRNRGGETPLQGVFTNNLGDKIAMDLINSPKMDQNLADATGRTVMAWAAESGNVEAVRLLLRILKFPGNFDWQTPLSLAIRRRHKMIVELLLSRDEVDANYLGENCLTPLWTAIEGVEAMKRESPTPDVSKIGVLLETESLDLNTIGPNDCAPIMWAPLSGYDNLVETRILTSETPMGGHCYH